MITVLIVLPATDSIAVFTVLSAFTAPDTTSSNQCFCSVLLATVNQQLSLYFFVFLLLLQGQPAVIYVVDVVTATERTKGY